MRAFIDTSALVKKYIQEAGAEQFEEFLKSISEIAVAPTYWIEFNSAVHKRLLSKHLTRKNSDHILTEGKKDLIFFHTVIWNDSLEQEALKLIEKYSIRTLDAIQLASGVLSESDFFVTSDRKLLSYAKKEVKQAVLISSE